MCCKLNDARPVLFSLVMPAVMRYVAGGNLRSNAPPKTCRRVPPHRALQLCAGGSLRASGGEKSVALPEPQCHLPAGWQRGVRASESSTNRLYGRGRVCPERWRWDEVVRMFYSPAVLACAMVIQVLKNHGKGKRHWPTAKIREENRHSACQSV